MSKLLFNDLVAVVTGSGGGLGRTYALELAKRGAKVVVNDLGVFTDGQGTDLSPANKVVNEIKEFGGIAYPNYDSVENGDKIIETAIKIFGKIDILINNAGILRDKSFLQMSDNDWNQVLNVHLYGAYKTTKSAWNYMRNQKFGRIIFTSSSSGIYGNFGQANYSAAKLGLVGLCNTLAIEGAKYNIKCNTIAPVAGSRLTENVFPPELYNALKPEYVSPLVLYLCHPSNMNSGKLFEVGAGWIGKVRWEVSRGVVLKTKQNQFFTVEDVRDRWDEISDFTESRHPTSNKDSIQNFFEVSQSETEENTENDSNDSNNSFSLESFIGKSKTSSLDSITFQKAILYAISVGINNSKIENLKFLYENHSNFSVMPTYTVIASFDNVFNMLNEVMSASGNTFDLSQILHAEQYLEVYKPLGINEKYTISSEIVDIIDKIHGAIILVDATLRNSQNELVSKTQFSFYIMGAGGFNGRKRSTKEYTIKKMPDRNPDVIIEHYIDPNQAVLYRLNGDLNPLHIDPEFSILAGFKTPILHGLCSFGIVSQQALNIFANGNVNKFKKIKVRFAKPLTPGQTLITEFWKENNVIYVQCKIKETGIVCLSGGYIELFDESVKPKL